MAILLRCQLSLSEGVCGNLVGKHLDSFFGFLEMVCPKTISKPFLPLRGRDENNTRIFPVGVYYSEEFKYRPRLQSDPNLRLPL